MKEGLKRSELESNTVYKCRRSNRFVIVREVNIKAGGYGEVGVLAESWNGVKYDMITVSDFQLQESTQVGLPILELINGEVFADLISNRNVLIGEKNPNGAKFATAIAYNENGNVYDDIMVTNGQLILIKNNEN